MKFCLKDLPSTLLEERSPELAVARYHNTFNETKKQLVLAALDETNGSPIEAALACWEFIPNTCTA